MEVRTNFNEKRQWFRGTLVCNEDPVLDGCLFVVAKWNVYHQSRNQHV